MLTLLVGGYVPRVKTATTSTDFPLYMISFLQTWTALDATNFQITVMIWVCNNLQSLNNRTVLINLLSEGGVGSFSRQNRTIYIGRIHSSDDIEEVVARHFAEVSLLCNLLMVL